MGKMIANSRAWLWPGGIPLLVLAGLGWWLVSAGLGGVLLVLPGLGEMGMADMDREAGRLARWLVAATAALACIGLRPGAWFGLGALAGVLALALQRTLADARMLAAGGGDLGNAAAGVLAGTRPLAGAYFLVGGTLMLGVAVWWSGRGFRNFAKNGGER